MRKLAVWLLWNNFSEYYVRQLAGAISERYETTVTYEPLDWSAFDLVYCFFPYPNRRPDCERGKIVKSVWEPHEFGHAEDAGLVLTHSRRVYERVVGRYKERAVYLPWAVNSCQFCPQPFPEEGRVVGWAGNYANPRKCYPQMEAALKATPGVTWRPNLSSTWRGRQVGPYDSVADMPDYYRQIHIYANASAWEGFGFPFLEAAACGRAVVTTDVGCARDLLDSGAGVVLVEDLEALGAAVVGVDYEELGARSAQAVRAAWTWETRAQDWMGVLDGAG